jgi:beta-lactamase class A
LQQKIAAEALRIGGPNVRVGASATNLVTGEKVGLHADDAFPSASVMKLPILVELERQIAAGTLSWTESLRAEASAMIAVSDNSAANQIADVIHTQAVNDTMAKLGLGSTRFLNAFTDTRSSSNPGQNQSTPGNMAHLLGLIATDQLVSSQVSADIRTLLSRNVDRSKLARLLPTDARLAHKSGWYETVANDVGIVTVDRVPTRWVIAVFTEGVPDAETGNQIVAAISKAVYDAWAP